MDCVIDTERLRLRPWVIEDAEQALDIFSSQEVTRWVVPAIEVVQSDRDMQLVLEQWIRENDRAFAPAGRWAMELRSSRQVIGQVALLYLPSGGYELQIAWQLAPASWRLGYASEAASALAGWAFQQSGVTELFTLTHDRNSRGMATARRLGMEPMGETKQYYGLPLQVFRLAKTA